MGGGEPERAGLRAAGFSDGKAGGARGPAVWDGQEGGGRVPAVPWEGSGQRGR